MATVKVWQRVEVTDAAGEIHTMGSLTSADSVTAATGTCFDNTYSIADSTVTEIWSDTNLADFDFFAIESDKAGTIQILTGEGETGEQANHITLAAGIPLILAGGDASKRNVTVDTWESTGSADDIDRIEYYFAGGSTSIVRVLAVT